MVTKITCLIFTVKPRVPERMSTSMANGFDRLEKLFSSSRRKDKAVQEKKSFETKHVFPSPSYLRPTSIHMMPRAARVEDHEGFAEDRGRSHSLPGPKFNEQLPTSGRRPSTKYGQSCRSPKGHIRTPDSVIEHSHDSSSSAAPRLSEFRFPEDSLFLHDELLRISRGASPPINSSTSRLRENKAKEHQSAIEKRSKRSLDYPPTHISSQFNPRDSGSASENRSRERENSVESLILLPAPIITRSSTVILRRQGSVRHRSTATSPTTPTKQASEPKFSLFPKQPHIPPYPTTLIDSPPASDNGEDHFSSTIKRSKSTTSLPTPDSSVAPSLGSPTGFGTPRQEEDWQSKRDTWETWGYRPDDPAGGCDLEKSNDSALRSRLLRKSASTSTLSIVTSQIVKDRTLWEPTLDAFFELDDDDVAEPRLASSMPDAHKAPKPPPKAPTPPPKDTPRLDTNFRDLPLQSSFP